MKILKGVVRGNLVLLEESPEVAEGAKAVVIVEAEVSSAPRTRMAIQKDLPGFMSGLGKDLWDALGGADKFLQEERESWD